MGRRISTNRMCDICHKRISTLDEKATIYPNFVLVIETVDNVGAEGHFCSFKCMLTVVPKEEIDAAAKGTVG